MTRPGFRALLFAIAAFAAPPEPARADDHTNEFVPELNVYVQLSSQVRLYLLGDITQGLSPDVTDGEVGAHLDLTLKPFLRPGLWDDDWERDRYLGIRVGYLVSGDLDGRDDGSTTKTFLFEMTGRLELPAEFWLVGRGRLDVRDIDSDLSNRYRFRLGIERELTVFDVVMVPYVQAETFYDTRFDAWNRQCYQAGVEFELAEGWRIEPYVARQNDSGSESGNVNRFGLVLKCYF